MADFPFVKMHGAGNDYVFVDGFETGLPDSPHELAHVISDRHRGVGSDGLVYLVPPQDDSVDVTMRMWNADGSEGVMCGNAVRCVALWMHLTGRIKSDCRVGTASRRVLVSALDVSQPTASGNFSVDMGPPEFESGQATAQWETIPDVFLPATPSTIATPVRISVVWMGNPHAVLLGEPVSSNVVSHVGPILETHRRFPHGTNVEFVDVRSACELSVQVWERGSGLTLACGSGACAAAVAAVCHGHCPRGSVIQVLMPGGDLQVCWTESGNVLLLGPAQVSFRGHWQDSGC